MASDPRPGSRKDHPMTASDTSRGAQAAPGAGSPAGPPPAAVAPAPAQLRQGDVLLVPVDEIPVEARPLRRTGGRVVLAEGEVTGHAHAIRSSAATLLGTGDERYLRVAAPVSLDHEEHAQIAIGAGMYRVVIQREYVSPEISSVAFRRVFD
jgi:hypothetical protein